MKNLPSLKSLVPMKTQLAITSRIARSLSLILLLLSTVAVAKADSPSFSNGTFTTDSVLDLAGTEVYGVAIDRGTSTITTANDYFFNGSYGTLGSDEITNINAGGFFSNFISDTDSPAYSATTGDAAFDSVLQSGMYNGAAETYTLNGLVGGLTYNVLVVMADNRPPQGTFTTFAITDGTDTSDPQNFRFADGTGVVATDIPAGDPSTTDQVEGGYLLDTFTEPLGSTTHDITIGTSIEVSGILVGTGPTPEPATYALLSGGLIALLAIQYRRRRLP